MPVEVALTVSVMTEEQLELLELETASTSALLVLERVTVEATELSGVEEMVLLRVMVLVPVCVRVRCSVRVIVGSIEEMIEVSVGTTARAWRASKLPLAWTWSCATAPKAARAIEYARMMERRVFCCGERVIEVEVEVGC